MQASAASPHLVPRAHCHPGPSCATVQLPRPMTSMAVTVLTQPWLAAPPTLALAAPLAALSVLMCAAASSAAQQPQAAAALCLRLERC